MPRQKGKKDYSEDLRNLAVKHYQDGKSLATISSQILFMPKTTVYYIVQKFKKMKTVKNIGLPRGRKRKTTREIDNAIINKVHDDRKKASKSIQKEIEEEYGVSVSSRLVRRRLNEHGFRSKVAKKKPLVTNIHRLKRLGYCYSYSANSIKFWYRVLWCDEAKFELIDSNRRQLVWARRGESLPANYFTPTAQQGGGHVM
ncbi:unnamed protein product, partial [Rotaria sp. Silwood1]